MNFMVMGYLLERYGPRLNMEQLAEVLGIVRTTLYNKIVAGNCPVPTYKEEGGDRFAAAEHVAHYLQQFKEKAERRNPVEAMPAPMKRRRKR